jgi:3',5'-cyclic AMP phosphodiesterase CpdA
VGEAMAAPKPITILHLSDPQFGRNHRFGRLAPAASDGSMDSLFVRLQDDLEILKKNHELVPDLLAVTGDLAEWGKKTEFEDIFSFLDRMAGLLGLKRDRVLIVPGNHDINRKSCESYFAHCEADDQEPKFPFWPKLRQYTDFFQRFYAGFPEIRFTEQEPWTLFQVPELKVVVAGLNSTMKESHRDCDHYGWVGEEQLRWFAARLRSYHERGWLRLGLVHHNVFRRAIEDEENLRDTDELRRRLSDQLNLLLHGHTHEGRLEWLGQKLPVLSTGSASVVQAARPHEVPNQYQVIRVYPERIWYGTRQYAPDQKRWIGDTRSSPKGDEWFHEESIPFENVEGTFGHRGTVDSARTDHLAAVVEAYRTYVATTFRRQTLHELCIYAEDQDLPGGLALLDIFIPQAVHLSPPPKDLPRRLELEAKPVEYLRLDEMESAQLPWGDSPPTSIEEVLLDQKQPWTFLLGAPGAGKTSLTRWLCLKLCTPGESLPGLASDLLPVRVEMRRFDERYRAATSQGRSYDFFDYLDQEHAEKALALRGDLLRELSAQGRLVWLFDGLDEVADLISRQRYAEMIVGLQSLKRARGVITSRIVGAQPVLPTFQAAGICVCTLLDFDEPRIQEFITRWHQKAFPGAPEAAAARRERLERVLTESRPVADLCRNPLLLTLIALLNRGGELPRRRHLLYRRAVELMASQWEANKRLSQSSAITFELEDKIEFLRELAWWMHFELPGGQRNLVPEEELAAFTSRFLGKRFGKTPDQAQRYAHALIGHLRERSYILARVGGHLFGFVHKTFLEYLVADAIRSRFAGRELDLGWLITLFRQHWPEDAWQEVLTLVCGMLEEDRPENVMRILQGVLPSVAIDPRMSLRFGAFSTRCLAEIRQLDREPLRTFMMHLGEFARHQILQPEATIERDLFAEAIHLIGTRWPERDQWSRWAFENRRDEYSIRSVVTTCALETTPSNSHTGLLRKLLSNESSDLIAFQLLSKAAFSPETLLFSSEPGEDQELLRCTVAGAILYGSHKLNLTFEQNRLLGDSRGILTDLLTSSPYREVKLRAARELAPYETNPLIGEVLLEYLRSPDADPAKLALSSFALGNFALSNPDFISRLYVLPREVPNGLARVGAADALAIADRPVEAARSILEWVDTALIAPYQELAEQKLLRLAQEFKQVRELLEDLLTQETPKRRREIVAKICDWVSFFRDQHKFYRVPLSQLLVAIERPDGFRNLAEIILWNLTSFPPTDTLCDRARDLLRKFTDVDHPPLHRLLAAEILIKASLVPREEGIAVLRELVESSSDEAVLLRAATHLCEEGQPVIESLVANAVDEKTRSEATVVARTLQLRAELLSVGSEVARG